MAPTYPGLFKVRVDGLAAAQVARLRAGQVVYESVVRAGAGGAFEPAPISLANPAENPTLVLYATGLNGATDVIATIGGVNAPVDFAGPQGTWAGLEQMLGQWWFWLGNQGWEYLELGRVWQVLLQTSHHETPTPR